MSPNNFLPFSDDKLGPLQNEVFYVEICGLYISNLLPKLGNKNYAQLPILRVIDTRDLDSSMNPREVRTGKMEPEQHEYK
jgi:hypothetical protein